MLLFLNRAVISLVDLYAFARAVWADARSMERAAEERYGPLGF